MQPLTELQIQQLRAPRHSADHRDLIRPHHSVLHHPPEHLQRVHG
uniref:Uncharacterized protein n=1 Tax=Arundo donax TaxID=35708 RepID=A0A0A9BPX1_ARUDO